MIQNNLNHNIIVIAILNSRNYVNLHIKYIKRIITIEIKINNVKCQNKSNINRSEFVDKIKFMWV